MKTIVKLVLIIFITFLAAPTIVSIIKESIDTSLVYNMSEEEHSHKEVKAECQLFFNSIEDAVIFFPQNSQKIASGNDQKHDSLSEEIFSPPPELV